MSIATLLPALLTTLKDEPDTAKVTAAPDLTPIVNEVLPKTTPDVVTKFVAVIIPILTFVVVFIPTPASLVIAIYLFSYLCVITLMEQL